MKRFLEISTVRKQPTFCDVTTGFPANEILVTSTEIQY